jgi:hypothetical protein
MIDYIKNHLSNIWFQSDFSEGYIWNAIVDCRFKLLILKYFLYLILMVIMIEPLSV